ncbi:MAG: hypothetical protein ACI379_07450 [Nocardioides sp.]|uniref:hypothetical protein n=1 Tax=Nocardioides sp. TaxID=35761 RepID=UPI003EFDF7D1
MDPRRLLPVLLALCAVAVVTTLGVRVGLPWWQGRDGGSTPPSGGLSDARVVLAAWDDRRAAAWASGDAGALEALYAAGVPAGRADVAALEQYRARGFVVVGITSQVTAFRVVKETDARVVVEVTDRVVGARAVAGEASTPLPRSRPVARRITLVQTHGTWVVSAVKRLDGGP